jgi:hypothetical protein
MADSSGHPNDAGKKAAAKAAASSSVLSSSSDDSSDDLSNDREDGARSARTLGRGKDLGFQRRFGQGNTVRLGAPLDESSEDSSNGHNEGAHSATTTGRGKILAGKSYSECYLQPKIGPPSPYQEMLLNVFTLMCSRPILVTNFQMQKSLMK